MKNNISNSKSHLENIKLNITLKEIIIFLLIALLIGVIPFVLVGTKDVCDFLNTGPIGDTIGGITAPFLSFFAAVLVYLALKAQIEANEKIQTQFEEQQKTNYRQNFETTFFNLLANHHQIVENIDFNGTFSNYHKVNGYIFPIYETSKKEFKSRDVFKESFDVLYKLIHDDLWSTNQIVANSNAHVRQHKLMDFKLIDIFKNESIITKNPECEKNTKFQSIYDHIYFNLNTDFGHYFRNLYRIIKMVDEKIFDKDPDEDFKIKYEYTSIVRAQLSDYEIQWLFFNCLSDKGIEKFKPFLEKYAILKIIDIENDPVYKFYCDFYLPSAFNKSKNIETQN